MNEDLASASRIPLEIVAGFKPVSTTYGTKYIQLGFLLRTPLIVTEVPQSGSLLSFVSHFGSEI